MNSKSYCSPGVEFRFVVFLALLAICSSRESVEKAFAGDAPSWMRVLVTARMPQHDAETDAILLYSDHSVIVESETRIKTVIRRATGSCVRAETRMVM